MEYANKDSVNAQWAMSTQKEIIIDAKHFVSRLVETEPVSCRVVASAIKASSSTTEVRIFVYVWKKCSDSRFSWLKADARQAVEMVTAKKVNASATWDSNTRRMMSSTASRTVRSRVSMVFVQVITVADASKVMRTQTIQANVPQFVNRVVGTGSALDQMSAAVMLGSCRRREACTDAKVS